MQHHLLTLEPPDAWANYLVNRHFPNIVEAQDDCLVTWQFPCFSPMRGLIVS